MMPHQHVGIVLEIAVNNVPRERLFGRPNRICNELVVVIRQIVPRACHVMGYYDYHGCVYRLSTICVYYLFNE